MFFWAQKNEKARHWQKQSFCALFRSCKQHPSVTQNLPQTTFRSNIGDKRTRFPRNNSNTVIHRSNSFYPVSDARTVVCCVFDSAGGFRELPVQENRARTCHPERSEGSQTKCSLKIEKQSQRYQSIRILRFFASLRMTGARSVLFTGNFSKLPAPLKIQLMAACLQAIVRQCGATALLATT